MVAVTPHVRVLPTREDNAFSMEPALLEAAIKEDLAAGERTCCSMAAALHWLPAHVCSLRAPPARLRCTTEGCHQGLRSLV